MRKAYPTWFSFGALVLYAAFVLLPSLLGLGYAFTDWSGFSTDIHWVGLANFVTIFQPNSEYRIAIVNTVLFTIATIILKTVIALALAMLLTSGVRRLSYLYRALIYLPALLPMVVVGIVFKSALDPNVGLLNSTLRSVGLGFLAQQWLTNLSLAALERDRRRHLEGCWLHHGDPHRRSQCNSARLLRIGEDRWRFKLAGFPPHYPAVAQARARRDDCTQPPVRPARVRHRLRLDQRDGPGYATSTVYTTIFDAFSLGQWGVATALSSVP